MIVEIDGQRFDVPDDATPDEIDAITSPAPAAEAKPAPSVADSALTGVYRGAWAPIAAMSESPPGVAGRWIGKQLGITDGGPLDNAKAQAVLDWVMRKAKGAEAPPLAELDRGQRNLEAEREKAHPIPTGIGMGIGALPASLAMGAAMGPAAGAASPLASEASRRVASGVNTGLQSAAIEAGVTADQPWTDRLLRTGIAGGVGFGMGALVPGAPPRPAGAHLPSVSSPAADFFADKAERAAIRATGADRTAIKRTLLREGGEDRAHDVGRFMLDEPGMKLRSPGAIGEGAEAVLAREGPEIGALTKAGDAAGAQIDVASLVSRAQQEVVAKIAANPLQKVPGHNGHLVNPVADRITGFLDDIASRAQSGGISPSDAHVIRQQMDEFLRGVRGAQDPESTFLKSAMADVRRILSDEIGSAMDRAGLGEQWATANQRFHRASDVSKLAAVGTERRGGNAFLSPTEKGGGLVGATMAAMGEPVMGGALAVGTVAGKRYGAPVAARGLDALSRAFTTTAPAPGAATVPGTPIALTPAMLEWLRAKYGLAPAMVGAEEGSSP